MLRPSATYLSLLLILFPFQGIAMPSPDVSATGHDAITTPGKPVQVKAKFELNLVGFVRPDLVRKKVTIAVLRRQHADRTDGDGMAEAVVTPPTKGVFTIESRLVEDPEAPPARGLLYVVAPDHPVAIVDIDGTISAMSDWKVPFAGEDADAFPGAAVLLNDLARTHWIVYLTARDDAFDAKTRTFLLRHGFPTGPVLYNEWGIRGEAASQLNPKNHGKFKLKVIRELMDRGLKVTVGIGNSETDAYAYEQARIKSYILTKEPGEGPSFRFTHYDQLRPRLVEDEVLKKRAKKPSKQ